MMSDALIHLLIPQTDVEESEKAAQCRVARAITPRVDLVEM